MARVVAPQSGASSAAPLWAVVAARALALPRASQRQQAVGAASVVARHPLVVGQPVGQAQVQVLVVVVVVLEVELLANQSVEVAECPRTEKH